MRPTRGNRHPKLGILSIKNQITKRKILYMHRVLNLKAQNITRKVMEEQSNRPGRTWISNIINDLREIGLETELKEIIKMTKNILKNKLNKALINEEQKSFEQWVKNSKKCTEIKEEKFAMKKYLNVLKPTEAIIILKVRLGMIEVKTNFKNMHENLICEICNVEENLYHLLTCQTKNLDKQKTIKSINLIYQNNQNMTKLAEIAIVIKIKLNKCLTRGASVTSIEEDI